MKSTYFILTLAFLTAWGSQTYGQSIKKADKRVTFYEYAIAIPVLENIITKDKDGKQEAMELLADCYRLTGDEEKAADMYGKVIDSAGIDPINHYYYGQVLRTLGKYQEAKEQFLTYARLVPDDPKGSLFAEYCEEIYSLLNTAPKNQAHNISSLNTENSEFSPIIYKDGVLFSSDRKLKKYLNPTYDWTGAPYLNFFFATADSSSPLYDPSYAEAESFSNKLNDVYHDGTAVLNNAEDVIYFTRTIKKKGEKDQDNIITYRLKIYTSELADGKWTKAKPINLNSDTYSIGHPALSPDDNKLYFVSDMPEGFGGTDLYVSEWTEEGWGEPKNLGPVINTSENEMFPYMHEDGTLYFASAGHLGYGGLDVFYSKQEDDGWSEPVNMMAPLNSSYDDFGITFIPGLNIGLFSSNRPGGAGKDDIYAFEGLITVSGKVLACSDLGVDCVPLANATVFVLDKNTNKVNILKTDLAGHYELEVSPRSEYAIKASKEGYFSDCSSISVGNKYFTVRDLILEKPKAGKVFTVDNIYYDFDKSFIREDAKPALNNLVRIMQENPITVELSSHTDCRGSDEYNMKLSQRRAQAAVDYIIEHGVDANRITAKGYGESKPVVICNPCLSCTEEEHQLNRRTEFKIISVTPEPPPKEIEESKYLNGDLFNKDSFSKSFFEGCNFSEQLDN